jgi:hypothetical protein
MVVETCSDGVDQYSRSRSTPAHGKPRGTLLHFYAAHHHRCLYTSGCRLALVILLCLGLFFQAAAQCPPPPQSPGSPYPGWDRQLLYSSYYVYYPIINPVLIFARNFLVDSERCVLLTYICAAHVEYIFIFQKQDIHYFASHSIGRNT